MMFGVGKETVNRNKAAYPHNRLLALFWLTMLMFSSYQLCSLYIGYDKNRTELSKAKEIYYSGHLGEIAAKGSISSGFHTLLQLNPDIAGWLKIDDTPIDYPIVQADNNDDYLNRNYMREPMNAGSIFMDFRNDIAAQNRNTVLYGHRMKDGSMFGSLKKFLDNDFFNTHRTFRYSTLYKNYEAEIFSVYYTTTDVDYIQTRFVSDEDFTSFLQSVRERSIYKTDTVVTAEHPIITLSTCDYTLDPVEGRLAVHAKLVDKD